MIPARAATTGVFLAAMVAAHAFAQSGPAAVPAWFRGGLTHSAGVTRSLEQHGMTLQSLLVQDLSRSVASDTATQPWFSRYSWDFTANIDGEKAIGWRGLAGALHFKQHRSAYGSAYSLPVQGYSNIDAQPYTGLYEAWGQQQLAGNHLRLKAGKIDANTEFATVGSAADFLNSSMGYSPTLMQFPTYPNPRPGFAVFAAAGRWQGGFGQFATTSGTFSVAEGSLARPSGRLAFGFWDLRQRLPRFDGTQARGTHGIYAVLEQTLWQGSARPEIARGSAPPGRRLAAFLQTGNGQGAVNPYTLHLGGGVVLRAPLLHRLDDALGVAATWVRLTPVPQAGFDAGGELVFESCYRASLTRTLSLVSDVQYFRHPGGLRSNRDTLIATPRLVFSF